MNSYWWNLQTAAPANSCTTAGVTLESLMETAKLFEWGGVQKPPERPEVLDGNYPHGYSTVDGVHVGCRRRSGTAQGASIWAEIRIGDLVMLKHQSRLKMTMRLIVHESQRRFGVEYEMYRDAIKCESVIYFTK